MAKWKVMFAAGLLFPAVALARSGDALQPDNLWSAWKFDPGVVIPLAIAALLYMRGARAQCVSSTPARLFLVRLDLACNCSSLAIASSE